MKTLYKKYSISGYLVEARQLNIIQIGIYVNEIQLVAVDIITSKRYVHEQARTLVEVACAVLDH